jgi:hypothetical protein
MAEQKPYTIGKGKLLFRRAGEINFADLGNTPDFKITTTIDVKEHFSSRSGIQTKDDEAILKSKGTGQFSLDEPNIRNLRMFVMSREDIANEVQSIASVSNEALTAELSRWLKLTKKKVSNVVVKAADDAAWEEATITGTTIAFVDGGAGLADTITDSGSGLVTAGFKSGMTVVVSGSASNNVTCLVSNVAAGVLTVPAGILAEEVAGDTVTIKRVVLAGEYAIPTVANGFRYECTTPGSVGSTEPAWPAVVGGTVTDGTVVWTCRRQTFLVNTDYILEAEEGLIYIDSSGQIPDGQALKVAFDAAAVSWERAGAVSSTTVYGDILFIGDPPKGRKLTVRGYVSMKPSGDLSLIGEDWMSFAFAMEFLSSTDYPDGLYEITDRGIVS